MVLQNLCVSPVDRHGIRIAEDDSQVIVGTSGADALVANKGWSGMNVHPPIRSTPMVPSMWIYPLPNHGSTVYGGVYYQGDDSHVLVNQ